MAAAAILILAARVGAAGTNSIPAQADGIDFHREIRPILENHCLRCHGPERPKSHFRLDNRADALRGGSENGDDLVPGHSDRSKLIEYVAGLDKDMQMPPPGRGEPLTPEQVARLAKWIDDGASWGTNSSSRLALSISPELRWTGVDGDGHKFRELEGIPGGAGGGLENFSVSQQINPDEKMSVEGRVLLPENDFKMAFALDRNDVGFVHGGFEEWRKYFDDTGGFYPGFSPGTFSLGRDLHEDIGRAWIDFGLALPDRPLLVVGYEYQFKQGAESTLAWGTVNQGGASRNIYPDEQDVNEHTHIFKASLVEEWNGWEIEDRARVEVYHLGESRNDVSGYSGGPAPDAIQRVNQSVHYTLGANTFRVEKQVADWWLASFGSLFSRYDGTSALNENAVTGAGAPTFGNYWNASGITLRRDSKVVSVASLFLPVSGLSISTAAQGEWTEESGFGNVNLDFGDPAIPGLFFPVPGTVNANQDRSEYNESLSLRFTRVPRTILFAEARAQEEDVGQFDAVDNAEEPFQQRTDAANDSYDAKAGLTTSPWTWMETGAWFRRRESITAYDHLIDQSAAAGMGYPAFIRSRDIALDEVDAHLVVRPVYWMTARMSYDWDLTDYSSATDPVAGNISPGGALYDGRTESHDVGLNVTVTPRSQFYFSGSFTYGYSRTTTAPSAWPEVTAYFGNTYTVGASAGYRLNAKTEVTVNYTFSEATYGQNNVAGIPLGLDFERHEVLAGLTRRLTDNLSAALQYRFSRYVEPGSGGANHFTAHGIFATLVYRWP